MGYLNKEKINLSSNVDSKKHFVPGIILTIGNPGLLAFWTGILGASLVSSKEASATEAVILSLGIVLGAAIVLTILIALIHSGRKYLKPERFKYISLASGVILLGFALKFGYELVTLLAR
jgi:threonine/homoserine/homoserine lactone efflux protein